MSTLYAINPATQRLIKKAGPTYNKLKRKPRTTLQIPKTNTVVALDTKSRQIQYKACKSCYLLPPHSKYNTSSRPKYPICNRGSCKISCRGLVMALRRAQIQKNLYVQAKALAQLRKYCRK